MTSGLITPAELEMIRPSSGRLALQSGFCGAKSLIFELPSAFHDKYGLHSARISSQEGNCGANCPTWSTRSFGSFRPFGLRKGLAEQSPLPSLRRGLCPPRPPGLHGLRPFRQFCRRRRPEARRAVALGASKAGPSALTGGPNRRLGV